MSLKDLKSQVDKISFIHEEMKTTWKSVKPVKGPYREKMNALINLLRVQHVQIMSLLPKVEESITVRDETIRALGSKVADLRSKHQKSDPFYVTTNNLGPNVFNQHEEKEWSEAKRRILEEEMLRELARLSVGKLELQDSERQRWEANIAKSYRKHSTSRTSKSDPAVRNSKFGRYRNSRNSRSFESLSSECIINDRSSEEPSLADVLNTQTENSKNCTEIQRTKFPTPSTVPEYVGISWTSESESESSD